MRPICHSEPQAKNLAQRDFYAWLDASATGLSMTE